MADAPSPFLSSTWLAAARQVADGLDAEIAAAGDVVERPGVLTLESPVTIDVTVNETPDDVDTATGGVVACHVTADGQRIAVELGHLAAEGGEPEASVTTDYETAKAMFVSGDPAAFMQKFMGGSILVQGDLPRLIGLFAAMATAAANDPRAARATNSLRAITA